MPMAVRWSAMWPIFLSLVRPDKISSPITISAALTIVRLAAESWSMESFRRRFGSLEAENEIGVGCGLRHVPRTRKETQQIRLPDGAIVLNDQETRQGRRLSEIGHENAIFRAFHVKLHGVDAR